MSLTQKYIKIITMIDVAQNVYRDPEYSHFFKELKLAIGESFRSGKLHEEYSHFINRLNQISSLAEGHERFHKLLCKKGVHNFEKYQGEDVCIHCGVVKDSRDEQIEIEKSYLLDRLYEFKRSFPTLVSPSEDWLSNLAKYASLDEIEHVISRIQNELPQIIRGYGRNPQVVIEPRVIFNPLEGKVKFDLNPVMVELPSPEIFQHRNQELNKLEGYIQTLYK